uniref:Uncharacterized protein n=1 Tax=Pithovirus LCDPAC02 TaxID=2506601 RepID=A0A481YRD8_9VIRU|nr:MAG: hypothetical protein LCDPAC02_02330 [Pithovirus LCDPAC02]
MSLDMLDDMLDTFYDFIYDEIYRFKWNCYNYFMKYGITKIYISVFGITLYTEKYLLKISTWYYEGGCYENGIYHDDSIKTDRLECTYRNIVDKKLEGSEIIWGYSDCCEHGYLKIFNEYIRLHMSWNNGINLRESNIIIDIEKYNNIYTKKQYDIKNIYWEKTYRIKQCKCKTYTADMYYAHNRCCEDLNYIHKEIEYYKYNLENLLLDYLSF